MTTPDLNISGSPIYEHLVATSGDPYQPPAYQLPAAIPPPDGRGAEYGASTMLSQFLGRMLGDGQSWMAVVVFGGPLADQLRQYQQYGHHPQHGQYPLYPQDQQYAPHEQSAQAAMAEAYQAYHAQQAYQQMYQWWTARQPQPAAGGMPALDWAGWLGQTSQSARPEPLDERHEDEQEVRPEPSYERRGGRLSGRLGAAMRELRGR